MKILRFCTLARSEPPPVVKGFCSHFCAPTPPPSESPLEILWLLRVRHTRQTVRVRMH